MRLQSLKLKRYLSIEMETLEVSDLNVLIGANASGKSNLLDALRFLHEAVDGDFESPVQSRGGMIHLAWKGDEAREISLTTQFHDSEQTFEWSVTLVRQQYPAFTVREQVHSMKAESPPRELLCSQDGEGWWWSKEGRRVELAESPTKCALAAASADASFPARSVADFVKSWGFFDPSPGLLRRASRLQDATALDMYGRNLAARLYSLQATSPKRFSRIQSATRAILGVPEAIDFRVSEEDDRVFLVLRESGLLFQVHQVGCSSGTLRMLAMITALLGEPRATLVGIEEPENYIHPAALMTFAETVLKSEDRAQVILTTHSPILLDAFDDPGVVCTVRRSQNQGTKVSRENNPAAVRKALGESGFALGEWLQTKGFGA